MLEEIGMDMNAYITASVKALVREKRVPFEMATAQYIADQATLKKTVEASKALTFAYPTQTVSTQHTQGHAAPEKPAESVREAAYPIEMVTTQQYTADQTTALEKLAEAQREVENRNTKLLSHEEVFGKIRERHAYEI